MSPTAVKELGQKVLEVADLLDVIADPPRIDLPIREGSTAGDPVEK
jgi:hypothetical protein